MGITTSPPTKAACSSAMRMTAVRYSRVFSTSTRSIGTSSRVWRHVNSPMSTAPAAIRAMVTAISSTALNVESPYSSPVMPHAMSSTEGTSKGACSNSPLFSSETRTNTTTAAARTATMMNSARHPTVSTNMPEREGPMAGAKLMMRPTIPMALPRFSRGNASRMRVNTMGMTTPVAIACITRPASRKGNDGASAATKLPSPNHEMPPTNSLRVLKRPTKKAFRGMMTASTME